MIFTKLISTVFLFFKKLIKNPNYIESVNTLALRVFGIISLFGFTIYITNEYPIDIVGEYDFVRTYLLVVGCICMLGTDQSILYFAGFLRSQNDIISIKMLYTRIIIMISICSLFVTFVFVLVGHNAIFAFFKDAAIYDVLLKSNFVVIFYAVTLFNTEVIRALDNIYLSELFRNIFKYLSVIIGSVILSILHKEKYLVDVFLFGFVMLAIISSIVVVFKFSKINHSLKINYNIEHLSCNSVLQKSFPIAISSSAIFLLSTFDIFFLKIHFGNAEVAKYSVGLKMMTIIAMIIQMVNVNASSKIAKLFADRDFNALQSTVKTAVRITTVFSIFVVIAICISSRFILSLFGSAYQEAKYSMLILVLCQGISSLFGVSLMYLNMTGRQNLFQYLLIFAVIINFCLNYFFTSSIGMIGAATSFAVTLLFWNSFVAYYVFKTDKIKIYLH